MKINLKKIFTFYYAASDEFMKIFVKNSTIDCVSKDKDIENDLSKLCSNQVTLFFISNYVQKKINDLMIEHHRCSNTNQNTNQNSNQFSNQFKNQKPSQSTQFNENYNQQYYQESYDSNQSDQNNGRLGSPHVQFDFNSLIGQITVSR